MTTDSQYPIPDGFLCSGVISGIKEDKSKKDLGLIFAENDALIGGVYTQNMFPSAHVQYCRSLTPSQNFRALIVNSGNANAGTGEAGIKANLRLAESLAEQLDINQQQVFTSSTGIIGQAFPVDTIVSSLKSLVDNLKPDCTDVSQSIMTTDLRPKLASVQVYAGGEQFTITGFAKGSGMIHPNMGTMLSYILTDAPLPVGDIQSLVKRVADKSFNCVSIDGDTSTNDSFYLITSNPIYFDEKIPDKVEEGITEVAIQLAKQIAADGEGAEHLIEVRIKGLNPEISGQKVLNSILTSSLVKTAINGQDPNWGRILMAVGNGLVGSPVGTNEPISISVQGVPIYVKGEPFEFNKTELSQKMAHFEVGIDVDLHQGDLSLIGWGCDFSTEYVNINAEYST
jgi:glutamate N-acetyltransferase / amino-acid N-acetyltransferase